MAANLFRSDTRDDADDKTADHRHGNCPKRKMNPAKINRRDR
jgi:hypothetical protein